MRPILMAIAILPLTLGCVSTAAQAYQAGREAEAAGRVADAFTKYREAVRAEPGRAEYQSAYAKTQATLSASLSSDARQHEQDADWTKAALVWRQAADVDPDNEEFAVRRDLSALKAEGLGPLNWFRGVKQIQEQHPAHPIVRSSYERARDNAIAEQSTLAESQLEKGDPTAAVEAIEGALSVDETRVDETLVNRARAALLVQQGDQRMSAKDPFGAYERYERAQGLHPAPQIAKKLKIAKDRAAPIARRLDLAYALSSRGRYSKALSIYEKIVKMEGAPATVKQEIAEVRGALIAAECKKSTSETEAGRLASARRALSRALDVALIDGAVRDEAKTAAKQVSSDQLAEGLGRIEKLTTLPATIKSALEKLALKSLEKTVDRANEISKKNPTRALTMIAGLEKYADALPQISKLNRSLQVGAFASTLDAATAAARRGEDAKAAGLLGQALAMSEAPAALADPIKAGAKMLAASDYVRAEGSFRQALAAAPGSKLASTGLDITTLRGTSATNDAVAALKRGVDEESALAVLETAALAAPDHPNVKAGRDSLIARAEREAAGGDDASAAELLKMAGRLTALPPGARTSLSTAIESYADGDHQEAQASFAAVLRAASSAKVAIVGQALCDGRIKEARSDAEQKAAKIDELTTRAKNAADSGDLRAAQRALKAAAKVSPTVKPIATKVLAGVNTMTRGKPAEGIAALDASGLPKRDPFRVAADAYALATAKQLVERAKKTAKKKPARALEILESLEMFKSRLSEIGALEKSIQVAAFLARLDEAERQANAGRHAAAAKVLADALASSDAPAKVKAPAKAGIEHLAAGAFRLAERSFKLAEQAAGKSRLAERGRSIALSRSAVAESAARQSLEEGNDDVEAALVVLEAALAAEPDNQDVAAGAQALLTRAQAEADTAEDGAIAERLAQAARLSPAPPKAAPLISEGLAKLAAHKHASAEAAFRSARAKAPSDRVAMLGQMIAKKRLLASFESGQVDVSALDETTARTLAALRKDEPDRPEPAAAIAELLEGARVRANTGQTHEASRLLALAIIVEAPPAKLRAPLERGERLLAKDKPVDAAKAFAGALAIAPNDEVVQAAVAIAERARSNRLIAALAEGKDKQAQAALRDRLGSDAADGTKKEIFAAAAREADRGKFPRAAHLLDALNNLGKAGEIQAATRAANKLLAKSDFEAAEAEYKRAQVLGRAPIAKEGERIVFNRRVALMFAGVASLRDLSDLEGGAKATRELLLIDPYDKDGLAALETALDHALESAKKKDTTTLVRAMRAASTAVDATSEMSEGIGHLAAGRAKPAATAFQELERTLVPEEGETDGSLKKLLSLQRTVAQRGREIAQAGAGR